MLTEQQRAILRQSPIARKVRQAYPAGSAVVSVAGMAGEVKRHVPSTNAQGGALRVVWANGHEGLTSPCNVRPVCAHRYGRSCTVPPSEGRQKFCCWCVVDKPSAT